MQGNVVLRFRRGSESIKANTTRVGAVKGMTASVVFFFHEKRPECLVAHTGRRGGKKDAAENSPSKSKANYFKSELIV